MIKLDNGWCIEVENDSYNVQQAVMIKKKDGTEELGYKNKTYHSSIYHALRKYKKIVDAEYFAHNDVGLDEALQYFVEAEEKFLDFYNKIEKLINKSKV